MAIAHNFVLFSLKLWRLFKQTNFVILVGLSSTLGQSTTNVNNLVVELGSRIKINCTVNSPDSAIWRYAAPEWSTSRLLINRTSVVQSFTSWRLHLENTQDYNLIIESIEGRHAGTYICYNDPLVRGVSTELIVFKSLPVCTVTVNGRQVVNSSDVITMGTTLHFSCEFEYFGKLSVRSLRWIDGDGKDVSNSENSVVTDRVNDSWTNYGLSFHVVAPNPRIPPYTFTACLYINTKGSCSGSAASRRTNLFSWTSPEIQVTDDNTNNKFLTVNNVTTRTNSSLRMTSFEFSSMPVIPQRLTSYNSVRVVTTQTNWTTIRETSSIGERYERLERTETPVDVSGSFGTIFTTSTILLISLIVCAAIILILVLHCTYGACVRGRKSRNKIVPCTTVVDLENIDVSVVSSLSSHPYSQLDDENPYEEVKALEDVYSRLLHLQSNPLYAPHIPPIYSSLFPPPAKLNGIYLALVGGDTTGDESVRRVFKSVPNLASKMAIDEIAGEYLAFTPRVSVRTNHASLPKITYTSTSRST